MKAGSRSVVAWWYSPTTEKWMRWDAKPAASAGEAFERAARMVEWMPAGERFVDVWQMRGGKWAHETRYRFGA
jgi:hypothetical protein